MSQKSDNSPPSDGRLVAGCLVEVKAHRIYRNGQVVRISPKNSQVLALLLEHAGEVVSRNRILDTVWARMTVSDEVVTRAIKELREAFGDNAKSPRVIETISRVGYRITTQTEQTAELAVASLAGENGPHTDATNSPVPEPRSDIPVFNHGNVETSRASQRPGGRGVAVWAAVLLTAAVALVLVQPFLRTANHSPSGIEIPMHARPATFEPGQKLWARLSANGSHFAYLFHEEHRPGFEVRWRRLDSEHFHTLESADMARQSGAPALNFDGSKLAHTSFDERSAVLKVWSIGDDNSELLAEVKLPGLKHALLMDWLPDGDGLLLASATSVDPVPRLQLFSVRRNAFQELALPGRDARAEGWPRVSPDGKELLFVRWQATEAAVYRHTLGSDQSQLVGSFRNLMGLEWEVDQNSIVVAEKRGRDLVLNRFNRAGSLTSSWEWRDASQMARATRAGTWLVKKNSARVNLIDVERGRAPGSTQLIAAANSADTFPRWSPSGEDLLFVSDRTGEQKLWYWNPKSQQLRSLPLKPMPSISGLEWSASGEHFLVAFEGHEATLRIYDWASKEWRDSYPGTLRHASFSGRGSELIIVRERASGKTQTGYWDGRHFTHIQALGEGVEQAWQDPASDLVFSEKGDAGIWRFRIADQRKERIADIEAWRPRAWRVDGSRISVLQLQSDQELAVMVAPIASNAFQTLLTIPWISYPQQFSVHPLKPRITAPTLIEDGGDFFWFAHNKSTVFLPDP